MASLCKRQQCTIERRGFRQELDSWRHKLIHCVGFESILEGLFGPGLVEDLRLFKDCEPEAVSDWSFDENCLFCCLKRDKVKEHLVGLSNQGLDDTPKPLLVKDQTKINRLEKQAEEFLNAVLYRKDIPSFSDPHIPVVAREIMQRMIRQFAAEYTSKTSSSQDSVPDPQPSSDQSLPRPPSYPGAPPPTSPGATVSASAHNQNPVLSKLLMADQDSPLDLTIKKPPAEPTEQDGVLDLSLKKNRHSSSLPARSPYLSPATTPLKGESLDLRAAKAKDLQSTSTLEQFMAKLCSHHQRQIVDALGFLQTEVKAIASSSTSQASNPIFVNQGATTSSAASSMDTPVKAGSEPWLPISSTPKGYLEVHEMSHVMPSSFAKLENVPETPVTARTSISAGPPLDLRASGPGATKALDSPTLTAVDAEKNRHVDHAPLKMKIMKTSNLADGKKLSCVLTTALIPQSGPMEERHGISDSSNRAESHSARLSSPAKRHSHAHQARQRDILGHTKDTPIKQFSAYKTFSGFPPDSPRTARKTVRGSSDHRPRDSACRVVTDPDLGHCDIVYIDKPITECLREQRRHMHPRRNARKSTRGHMYVEEMWELKTVRTLAGRNERGNYPPNPLPELITLVTPKQMLAKHDGVPPVDMPFAGGCVETVSQQTPSEQADDREILGTGDVLEAAASEHDIIVETSQTDQIQSKEQSTPSSPLTSPTENTETDASTDVVQDTAADSGQTKERDVSEESVVEDTATDSGQTIERDLSESVVEDTATDSGQTKERDLSEESVVEDTSTDSGQTIERDLSQESVVEDTATDSGQTIERDLSQESVVEDTATDSGQTVERDLSEESVTQAPLETEKERRETDEVLNEIIEQVVAETEMELLDNEKADEPDPQRVSEEVPSSESEQPQEVDTLAPAEVNTEEKEVEVEKAESIEDVQPGEPEPETQKLPDDSGVEGKNNTEEAPAEEIVKVLEVDTVEPVNSDVVSLETAEEENNDGEEEEEEYDVSTKTLEALLGELPPWRRKRGMVISLPKRLRDAKSVIVGYVNGRPISQSDRSLRRRSYTSPPAPNKRRVKSGQITPKKTSGDATVENSPLPEHLMEEKSSVNPIEDTPVITQVKDPHPESTPSPASKRSSRSLTKSSKNKSEPSAKQIEPQTTAQGMQDTLPAPLEKPVDSPQSPTSKRPLRSPKSPTSKRPLRSPKSPTSKRPLRSARLKQAGTAVSPLPANAAASPVSQHPTTSRSRPSIEGLPPLPISSPPPLDSVSPLPVSSPPNISLVPPAAPEQSQQCAVPESTEELNTVKAPLADTHPSDIQKTEVESRLQPKKKLRPAKVTTEVNKNDTQQVGNEVSSPLQSQGVTKDEMQPPSTPVRSKRLLQKEEDANKCTLPKKSDVSALDDKTSGGESSSSSTSDKPARMPLRSESSKAEVSTQSVSQTNPGENKKSSLRSQRLASPSTSVPNTAEKPRELMSPIRMRSEKIIKTPTRSSLSASSVLQPSSTPGTVPKHQALKQTANKFLEALNGEDNQQLITNLNIKFDKMQKGWVQLDKEGQPATKYRNKADRQAAIWKSKRRTRKPKSLEHQRYSPVQMLFMKNFDLSSICRWFLESTETKSLVIVKKVNTRLPSETQLCFHSSSGVPGTSQGVFPSLQAERLKKHLKKFAIASPVKSTPRSQKLIAKALEQEASVVKGKEKQDLPTATRIFTKPHGSSVEVPPQTAETQKASAKSKNPASARILRKYSNIREKMQVQQTSVRLKEASRKSLKVTNVTTSKSASKSKLKSAVKGQKSPLPVSRRLKESVAKIERRKTSPGRKIPVKPIVQEKMVKTTTSSRASRDLVKKDAESPQRCSQRPGTPKTVKDTPVQTSVSKVDSNKKQLEAEKTVVEKPTPPRASAKAQTKEPSQSRVTQSGVTENKGAENAVETLQQNMDIKTPSPAPDQVLTRSQRKMEETSPLPGSPNSAPKRASKPTVTQSGTPKSATKRAQEPTVTQSGTPKSATKRAQDPTVTPSGTPKSATKRAQEPTVTPSGTPKSATKRAQEPTVTPSGTPKSATKRAQKPTVTPSGTPKSATKRAQDPTVTPSGTPKSATKRAQEPTPRRSGTPKSATRKVQASTPSRTGTSKSVTKRAPEPVPTPAKRTRMSHSK